MPLNTVHYYIKNLINGVQVPGTAGILEAFIKPPDPETEPTPKAYVWGSTEDEARLASPRVPISGEITQAGWKEANHLLDIWLVWFSDEDSDSDSLDIAFPAVVDAVAAILRKSPDPVQVTDPATGQDSQLADVGEQMSIDMYPPRATADQRVWRYDARIQLKIQELFQS